MRLLPDTNLLIYEMIEDAPYHEEAVKIYESANEIFIPSIVLHEFLWVTIKKLGIDKDIIVSKLEEYEMDWRIKFVEIPVKVYKEALRGLENASEVNDMIILFAAKFFDCTLGTFDEKLRKKAQKYKVKVVP